MAHDGVLLSVNNLTKIFKDGRREYRAADGVSFQINRGEVFGLVGESGCGKTTVGRCIIGLHRPTSGEIYFNGSCIASGECRKKDLKKRDPSGIQMIFQDPMSSLDPRMKVGEIIAEGPIIRGEMTRSDIYRRVYEVLGLVGLRREHAGRYPHEFSGGQRQRIGIARAVIMNPELIIADEPVSALDVSVQAQVINLLTELKDSLGMAVLFVAHDLSVVKYFSDRIGVMYKGRIVETATSDELFKNPLHPYTRSLLSAIPLPDPIYERRRKRTVYSSACNESDTDRSLYEITPRHFVMCSDDEYEILKGRMD